MKVDPELAPHKEHLLYRYSQYQNMKKSIEGAEGSLANFAQVRVCMKLQQLQRTTSNSVVFQCMEIGKL